MNRHFAFKLKDEVVRGMNREQYYSVSRWARFIAWKIDGMINWDKYHKHLSGTLVLGYSQINYEDLLI